MKLEAIFLRPDVQIEPLFNSWYAWSHLIPPATAARNLTERHLKIIDSYVDAPEVHANAVKNPKMLGGPFIDYGGRRVDEIVSLRDDMIKENAELIELSAAIGELDGMLRAEAKGLALDSLYSQVPTILQGYVELVYDLNNNASFRLFERLLYKSNYYRRSAQTIALSITRQDDRPFVLSTPRLKSKDSIHLPLSFDDKTIDKLVHLKRHGCPWEAILDLVDIQPNQEALFRSMFTGQPPPIYRPYSGAGVRWRYFGHACILIEIAGCSILFDPVLSYTYESDISRYTYQDLPDEIDFVVITHNHQDHILFETLLQIRSKVKKFIVPRSGSGALQDPSVKLILENIGCDNVFELSEMESIDFDGGSIMGLPFMGEHADLNIPSKMTYLLRLGQRSLLFLADSCNINPQLYQRVHRETGDVDALFLGMECDGAPLSWLYGPLLTRNLDRSMDASRRLAGSNYNQAISFVNLFQCKEAYVYAMGQEPWLNYVMSLKYSDQSRPIVDSNRLIKECQRRGICVERLFGEREILLDD